MSLFDKGLIIFPNKNYITGVYSDSISTLENYNKQEKSIELEYTLIKGIEYPFVGQYFNVSNPAKESYTDISSYKYLNIKIKATSSKNLKLYLLFYLKNFSQPGFYESHRFLEKFFR